MSTDDYKADGTPTHTSSIDGTPRKSRYGMGRQPWDDMVDLGWAPYFAAGSILKYLRREKDVEHSLESARWYYARLCQMVELKEDIVAWHVQQQLIKLLTGEEIAKILP